MKKKIIPLGLQNTLPSYNLYSYGALYFTELSIHYKSIQLNREISIGKNTEEQTAEKFQTQRSSCDFGFDS